MRLCIEAADSKFQARQRRRRNYLSFNRASATFREAYAATAYNVEGVVMAAVGGTRRTPSSFARYKRKGVPV